MEDKNMKSFEYTITDPVGIHARPAGLLVKEAKAYDSVITITKDGKSAEAKKLMALMGLGVKQGDAITVSVEGGDEEAVAAKMEEFFKANL
jgi:phosphocarrier protein